MVIGVITVDILLLLNETNLCRAVLVICVCYFGDRCVKRRRVLARGSWLSDGGGAGQGNDQVSPANEL